MKKNNEIKWNKIVELKNGQKVRLTNGINHEWQVCTARTISNTYEILFRSESELDCIKFIEDRI